MLASGHYLASMAGYAVLEAGGNAVDAGCAAGIALGVVQSDIVNVAGVAPILVRMADTGQVISIAGLGGWPKALDPAHFHKHHGGELPFGVLRTVVPAAPDAWLTALERFGTMRFAEVASHAIALAGDGLRMYPFLAQSLHEKQKEYARWPSNREIYLPGGRAPEVGDLFVQADLAATLQYLADEDLAAGPDRHAGYQAARRAFYEGDIASKIIAHQRENGGLLSHSDLKQYRSEVEPALRVTFRDLDVYSCGSWCQGPTFLQLLKLAECLDLSALEINSESYIHTIIEILKIAFRDRERYIGDPRFVQVPLKRLLSTQYAREQVAKVDPRRARDFSADTPIGGAVTSDPDTSYVCVVDQWGNAFSATPSDGSWESPVVPGTGLVPSSRGMQSRLDPGHPSALAPGKRPRLTPNPSIALRGDGQLLAFGTPGGDVQAQAMLQFMLNITIFGMDLQTAIEAPRFASYSFPSSFHPYEVRPGLLKLESRIPQATGEGLAARGHVVEYWPDWTSLAGGLCAVSFQESAGTKYMGAADPRRPSYAVGR